jgi:trigger factor
MQVTETLSDGLRRAFAVVVPAADIETRRATRFSEIAKQVNLPGFRPGKVPMPIVRQRFGGAVAAEVAEQSINEATRQLLSERDLRPAVMPKLEVVSVEPAAPGPAKDLEFKVELELLPDIAMPDFSALALTRRVAKVPDQEVDSAVADIAARNRELVDFTPEELAERGPSPGAAKGDVLTVDYLGKLDGVAFDGGAASDADIDIGGSGFIPGFVEQIEGMSPGDTRTIEVTFPVGYQAANLAGKVVTFDIVAKRLRKPVQPAIDDALAEKLGFDSLEHLRDTLRGIRQRRLDGLTRMRLKRDLLDALAEIARFEPPRSLADQEFDQIWKNLEASRANGTMDEDDKTKSEEQLRADYSAIADRRVRLGLLLGEIGRVNNIVVTPEEINAAIRAEAARYQGREAQIIEFYRTYPAATESLRGPIFEDKVVDYVLDSAQVTEAEISVEELEREPEEVRPAPAIASEAAAPADEDATPEHSAPVADAAESASALAGNGARPEPPVAESSPAVHFGETEPPVAEPTLAEPPPSTHVAETELPPAAHFGETGLSPAAQVADTELPAAHVAETELPAAPDETDHPSP